MPHQLPRDPYARFARKWFAQARFRVPQVLRFERPPGGFVTAREGVGFLVVATRAREH